MDGTLSATDVGDLVLGLGVRANDARSATLLLERHRDAVASLGPSRFFESVDASGRRAIALHRSGADDGLPFRALWLALHARGDVPLVEGVDAVVWDAFLALPPAWRLALWHREVEGQRLDQVARHLDLAGGQTAVALASAYASLDRRVATALADTLAAPGHEVERTLRDVLATAVLGDLAEAYLAERQRPDRLRVPEPVRLTRGAGRVRPLLAPLAAAGVGVVALVLVVATSFVNPSADRMPEAAGGDAPVPGTTFTPVDTSDAGGGDTPQADRGRDDGPVDDQTPSGAPGPPAPTGVPPVPPPTPTPPLVPDGPDTPEGPDGPNEPAAPVAVDVHEGGATVTVDTGEGDPVVVEVPLPDAPAAPALPSPPAPLPEATPPH